VGNVSIEDVDTAKKIILIGSNPRNEAPVLNARIRKAWLRGADVHHVGVLDGDLTYDVIHHGPGRKFLNGLVAEAKPGDEALVIVGQGAICEGDGIAVLGQCMALAEKSGGKMMVLHTAASRVGALDVGAVTEGGLDSAMDGADVVFNLGADEVEIADGPFVIYQGSHGDRGAHRADVILPGAAYTEENGLFVNTEGRPQLAMRAGFAPGDAKENWAILRALSAELGAALPYDSLAQLRQALVTEVPHLKQVDQVVENTWEPLPAAQLKSAKFFPSVKDFYLTNPIARASELMAELSANAQNRGKTKVAAE
jgi:NADH-quinone oxidoreductase subunit G